MTIWMMHGIVDNADPTRFTHRNMLDTRRFQRLLEERTPKFVDLDQALAGNGDALTIDDSTWAAADAAELCLSSGHAVTVFINARNIALQKTYWFALLNVLVDRCERNAIILTSESFSMNSLLDRQRFRKAAKHKALSLHSEEEREEFILRLALSVGVDSLEAPRHLATVTIDGISRLKAISVRIENHGWTHGNVAAMTRQELVEDIRRGADWLEDEAGIATRHYSVPFGATKPPDMLPISLYEFWHLADENLPTGLLDKRLVNRATLSDDSCASESLSVAKPQCSTKSHKVP
jgi:hypothetical protein